MSRMTKNDEQNDEVSRSFAVKNDEDYEGRGREGMCENWFLRKSGES